MSKNAKPGFSQAKTHLPKLQSEWVKDDEDFADDGTNSIGRDGTNSIGRDGTDGDGYDGDDDLQAFRAELMKYATGKTPTSAAASSAKPAKLRAAQGKFGTEAGTLTPSLHKATDKSPLGFLEGKVEHAVLVYEYAFSRKSARAAFETTQTILPALSRSETTDDSQQAHWKTPSNLLVVAAKLTGYRNNTDTRVCVYFTQNRGASFCSFQIPPKEASKPDYALGDRIEMSSSQKSFNFKRTFYSEDKTAAKVVAETHSEGEFEFTNGVEGLRKLLMECPLVWREQSSGGLDQLDARFDFESEPTLVDGVAIELKFEISYLIEPAAMIDHADSVIQKLIRPLRAAAK
jgi:hypothetical protein